MFSLAKISLNLKPPKASRVRLALCDGGDLLGMSGLNKASYSELTGSRNQELNRGIRQALLGANLDAPRSFN
jgi:hypothetical protein